MPIHLRSEGKDREINSVVSGRVFQTDQVMVCQLRAKQGETINPHSHEVDQITVMLKGCLDWQIEGEEKRQVRAGDVMVMPAGTLWRKGRRRCRVCRHLRTAKSGLRLGQARLTTPLVDTLPFTARPFPKACCDFASTAPASP